MINHERRIVDLSPFDPINLVDLNDSVEINDVRFLKTNWFRDRMASNSNFSGFFPRTTVPRTTITQATPDPKEMQALLLIIDSSEEIRAAFAPEFPCVVLGEKEIMINE